MEEGPSKEECEVVLVGEGRRRSPSFEATILILFELGGISLCPLPSTKHGSILTPGMWEPAKQCRDVWLCPHRFSDVIICST